MSFRSSCARTIFPHGESKNSLVNDLLRSLSKLSSNMHISGNSGNSAVGMEKQSLHISVTSVELTVLLLPTGQDVGVEVSMYKTLRSALVVCYQSGSTRNICGWQ